MVDYIAPELWSNYPVDKTFEVQIRTVFSEGWHEIEHDVRYKSLSDWDAQPDLSRNLNGILATLETCDWSIISILDDLAYREYKNRKWAEMMKNKLRIHLIDTSLDERILGIFDDKPEVAKSFLKIDRRAFLFYLSCESKMLVPLTLSNIVFVANLLWINNSDLLEITPKVFKEIIIKYG